MPCAKSRIFSPGIAALVSALLCLLFSLPVWAQARPTQDPGALIQMTLKGTVGVLLDEVPPGFRH
jgi:predicted small integral membrane protein